MNKYYKQFLQSNKKILDNKIYNTNIIISDRGRFEFSLIYAILGSALCNQIKSNAIILSDKNNKIYRNIFESFGFKNFFPNIKLKNFLNIKIIFIYISCLFILIRDLFIIKIKDYEWFFYKYEIDNIQIGDLIYNTYVRYNHSYLNFNLNLKFILILLSVIIKVKLINNIFDKNKIKYVISNGSAYASNSGILFRIASLRKIKILKIEKLYKNKVGYTTINRYFNFNYNSTYALLKNKMFLKKLNKINSKTLNKFINKRNEGKLKGNYTNILDLKNANKKNIFLSKKNLIKRVFKSKNYKKKIILIAPHIFSDAPLSDGKLLFMNYFQHLKETLDFIEYNNLNNVFWLVKPHPSRKSYNEIGIIENLLKNYKNKNIKLCPNNLTSKNTTKICDNVITCTGTASFEFGCEGKFSILAADAIYSKLGFTIDHSSKKSYFKTLQKIHRIPKIKEVQKIKAKRMLYGLEVLSGLIELEKSDILNDKVIHMSQKGGYNIFCKELIKNIKKKGILKDKMVISFLKGKFN